MLKREEREPREHVQCAHDMCPHSAIVALWMPGLTRLCRNHYEFHMGRQAKDFCATKGLVTNKQKRDWCLVNMPKKLPRIKLPAIREPGEDDEEIAA